VVVFKRFLAAVLLMGVMAPAALVVAVPAAEAADLTTQRELLSRAQFTLERFQASPKMADARALARQAKAIMIFPSLIKGALFVGGEGGNGVLLARRADGTWSYPAFYSLASLSFGLQIGGQQSEALLIIMTDAALRALMEDQAKLGGDVSAAAGPAGTGVEASTSTAVGTDIYTYSNTSGLFVGASLEGAVVARREDLNAEVYNGTIDPRNIVLENSVQNPIADSLRIMIAEYAQP
jgi:SH3 domain-containing YSC84-like protein 1